MPFNYEYDEERNTRRLRWLLKAFPYVLLFVFIVYFWPEIRDILTVFRFIFALILDTELPQIPPTLSSSIFKLSFIAIFGFGIPFAVWLLFFAWLAWLPVSSLDEIYQTAEHFILYARGRHGPAVFVKDGKLVKATPDELHRHRPGVLVIDYNSAVALEGGGFRRGWQGRLRRLYQGTLPAGSDQRTRISGPGITFTRAWEQIYGVGDVKGQKKVDEISGVADLRVLSRSDEKWLAKEPPPSGPRISCYTRDGIELKTGVNARFTIGQKPDIVQVTYQGERWPENLVVITLERVDGNRLRLKEINPRDELEDEDYLEIHQVASGLAFPGDYLPYPPLESTAPAAAPDFDPDRVFAAIYATARTPEREVIPWPYLPSHVALDMFREIMSRVNYDDLYALDENERPRIGEVQRRLRLRMRNNGLLSYRLVLHAYRRTWVEGNEYRAQDLRVSQVRPLTNPKVLRLRGIKVFGSGFSNLEPVSKEIYEKRLDSWRATWESDTTIARAGYALEAMRIHNRARVQAQRELMSSISQIFEIEGYSDEILAIRIFQALEKIAADPHTHKLLPGDTINLLRAMHDWLLPAPAVPPLPPAAR